ANSKLLEKEYDLSKMPEIEFKGRLVIDRLEKGYEPKNKKVADNWKGILDENKEKKLINNKQLNQAMEKLKMIMQKIISKIKDRSEEHTSELQSRFDLVCRLLLEKKKKKTMQQK